MPRRVVMRIGLGIVFALGACLGAASLGAEPTPAPRTGLQVGDLAPAFSLQTLDGKTLTRDGLKGKVEDAVSKALTAARKSPPKIDVAARR